MSRFVVRLAPSVVRQLEKIPPRIVPALIEFVYGPLADEPRRVGKPLGATFQGAFAARRGAYRVVYDIDDDAGEVRVIRVAHRADAYRPGPSAR